MAKKKAATKQVTPRRLETGRFDIVSMGIDLNAILEQIRPHLHGTHAEISKRAGGLAPNNVNCLLNGLKPPSLGGLAALAHASGGKLSIAYTPPSQPTSTSTQLPHHDSTQTADPR